MEIRTNTKPDPLLRPGREVDVIIVFDASADIKVDILTLQIGDICEYDS